MAKATSIMDVAKEADVSATTVSRVMNASSIPTEATRKKVLSVAKKLDYRPNLVARNLRRNRTGRTLGDIGRWVRNGSTCGPLGGGW